MTTRFLLTCISSFYFHKEETLDGLHEFIAKDAIELFHHGVEESRLYSIEFDGFAIGILCPFNNPSTHNNTHHVELRFYLASTFDWPA